MTGYAPVNGLNLYYEVHGASEPLIMLHGGLGSTEMFRPHRQNQEPHRVTISEQAVGEKIQAISASR